MNTDTEETAADVFGLLSEEIRVDILRTVARAQNEGHNPTIAELSFSDIYDRVDVDSTSKLSYHLEKLTGPFLRKHENGYAFTHAGERLTRFILAENYRNPPDIGTIEIDGGCWHCGETGLEATYHDQYFIIQCPSCDRPSFTYYVSPAQARTHEGAALLDAVKWEMVGEVLKMRQGICPFCGGRMTSEVIALDELAGDQTTLASFGAFSECQECLRLMSLPLTHAVVFHPASIAFHWHHGVDIIARGLWEFHRHLQDGRWTAEHIGTDPDEYCVELQHSTSSLKLYLDETATVTETERVRRREQDDRQIR